MWPATNAKLTMGLRRSLLPQSIDSWARRCTASSRSLAATFTTSPSKRSYTAGPGHSMWRPDPRTSAASKVRRLQHKVLTISQATGSEMIESSHQAWHVHWWGCSRMAQCPARGPQTPTRVLFVGQTLGSGCCSACSAGSVGQRRRRAGPASRGYFSSSAAAPGR